MVFKDRWLVKRGYSGTSAHFPTEEAALEWLDKIVEECAEPRGHIVEQARQKRLLRSVYTISPVTIIELD